MSGLTVRQTALQSLDAVLGAVEQGNDVGSLLSTLQGKFSTLLTDPSSQTAQSAVVSAAGSLTSGINSLSAAYTNSANLPRLALYPRSQRLIRPWPQSASSTTRSSRPHHLPKAPPLWKINVRRLSKHCRA